MKKFNRERINRRKRIDLYMEKNEHRCVNSMEELNWNTIECQNIYKILSFVECFFRDILI